MLQIKKFEVSYKVTYESDQIIRLKVNVKKFLTIKEMEALENANKNRIIYFNWFFLIYLSFAKLHSTFGRREVWNNEVTTHRWNLHAVRAIVLAKLEWTVK